MSECRHRGRKLKAQKIRLADFDSGRRSSRNCKGVSATVGSQDREPGSGASVAVREGDIDWRDERGIESPVGSSGERLFGRHGVAPETGLGE